MCFATCSARCFATLQPQRTGAMNLIQALIHDFNLDNDSTRTRRSARRLATTHPLLANVTRPSEAVEVLQNTSPHDRSELLNALIAASPVEPLAARVILHAYLPLVRHPNRTIRFFDATERDDLTADLVEAVYTTIATLAAEPPTPYPGTLIYRAIDKTARRWQREHQLRPDPFDHITDQTNGTILFTDMTVSERTRDLDFLLDVIVDATTVGLITPADATFTVRTIFDNATTKTEASRRYVGLRAMQKIHKRTTDTIVEHALAKVA